MNDTLLRRTLGSSSFRIVNMYVAKQTNNNAAILLSDLISKFEYFEKRGMLIDDEWFFNTAENIEEDTNIKRAKLDGCITILQDKGLIDVKLKGVPAKRHFKINTDKILEMMYEKPSIHCRLSETSKLDCRKTANKIVENKQCIKDIKENKLNKGITSLSKRVAQKSGGLFVDPSVVTVNPDKDKIAPDDFDIFWSIYPRKINKGYAKKIFTKLCKSRSKPDKVKFFKSVKRSCDAYIEDETELKFIPHPSTFLNRGSWDDVEVTATQKEIVSKPKNKITPEQLLQKSYDKFIPSWYKDIITEINNAFPNLDTCDILKGCIEISKWYVSNQNDALPAVERGLRSKVIMYENELLTAYIQWITNEKWLENPSANLFSPNSTVFKKFFGWIQSSYGYNFLNGVQYV